MRQYLDFVCDSGISGDMSVAALIDLATNLGYGEEVEKRLLATLQTFPIKDTYEIVISRVEKSGKDACDFDVVLFGEQENYDHDMEYLHGQKGEQEHEHEHHHVHQRGPKEIQEIFEISQMTDGAKEVANKILSIIAEAEAKAHQVPVEKVHFHEVGAIDSIIDIASLAICYDFLKEKEYFEEARVSVMAEGQGTVRCQHGILSVPVPAVKNIAEAYELPIQIGEVQGELITPTGAAIVAAVCTKSEKETVDIIAESATETKNVSAEGYGAGKRDYKTLGYLQVLLVRE